MEFKEAVAAQLSTVIGIDAGRLGALLEVPPDPALGDYALPCFSFAKELQKAPGEIAAAFAERAGGDGLIAGARATGPYLNLFLDRERVTQEVVSGIRDRKEEYGGGERRPEKVMIEYSQPNTHKAFHVGHLRGTSIGESLARILRHAGYEVVQANYSGDTGMHVAKWLWCYRKYHDGEEPPAEGRASWLAAIYVEAVKRLAEKPELEEEVRELNRRLDDANDEELMALWRQTRQWSIDEFNGIYKELGAHFDHWFWEREMEERAKSISKELLAKGIAEESEGAIIMDLEAEKKGVWVLLRNDGTPLYSAKDLALAEAKFDRYSITRSVYVVGKAQALHLEQLFLTLERMGFEHAGKCFHLSFEEVRLPDGKMSSRTGQNILYADLRDEVFSHTEREIRKRHGEWSEERIGEVVRAVGVCALKFEMIHRDHNKNIVFDAAKVCDFEGDTGPYIQYTHARCNSILKKLDREPTAGAADWGAATSDHEYALAKKLAAFPAAVEEVSTSLYPERLATYLLELAKAFNKFYHECQVVGSEAEAARPLLVDATRIVLERGLFLLGIEAPTEM